MGSIKNYPLSSYLSVAASVAVMLIICFSCSKKSHTYVAAPGINKPTTDFREKYKGTYYLSKRELDVLLPERPPTSDTTDITISYNVSIHYNIADSIEDVGLSKSFKRPALQLLYNNGSAEEYLGVDTNGRLYRSPDPNHTNNGGFITADSIWHVSFWGSSHSNKWTYLSGKRI